jgi:hypothetical protein
MTPTRRTLIVVGSTLEDDEEAPKSRTGRFFIPHRGGTRVEIGEPINCGGDKPWLCAVKLVGRATGGEPEADATQTLLVRTGRGATPEEAQRAALAQVTLVYGSPVEPPPEPRIQNKRTDPPPAPLDDDDDDGDPLPPTVKGGVDAAPAKRPGFFARLFARLR